MLDVKGLVYDTCLASFVFSTAMGIYYKVKSVDASHPSVRDGLVVAGCICIFWIASIPVLVVNFAFKDLSHITFPTTLWCSMADVLPRMTFSLVHIAGFYTDKTFSKAMKRILKDWIQDVIDKVWQVLNWRRSKVRFMIQPFE